MYGNSKKEIKKFICVLLMLAFVLFVRFFDGSLNWINSTMFAFSYKYGFISRGFIGSVYKVIDKILPIDLMNYSSLYVFVLVVTIIFYIILFVFFYVCLKKSSKKMLDHLMFLIVFYTIFAVPMFCNEENFGRLDIYCVLLSIIAATIIITQKLEWLVFPISMIGVMIHQGNVFMYLNIILVLLLYRAFTDNIKQRRKYLILFGLSFLSASALFVWFEFFSHFSGGNIYEEIYSVAVHLGNHGWVHQDVIDHEILGIDLSTREYGWRLLNLLQTPIYIIITIPYMVLGCKFVKGIWCGLKNKVEKLKYLIVFSGSLTIIPDLLLKCDYGRWIFAIITYYCVIVLALLAMKDKVIEAQFVLIMVELKNKGILLYVPLLLAILLQPLGDVSICPIVSFFSDNLNDLVFHLDIPEY